MSKPKGNAKLANVKRLVANWPQDIDENKLFRILAEIELNKTTNPAEHPAIVTHCSWKDKDIPHSDPFHDSSIEDLRVKNGHMQIADVKKRSIILVNVPSMIEGEMHSLKLRIDVSALEKRKPVKEEIVIIKFDDPEQLEFPRFARFPEKAPVMYKKHPNKKIKKP